MFLVWFILVDAVFVSTFANCQVAVYGKLTEFSAPTCQPDQPVCAISKANRSCSVRSQAQCVYECLHGEQTAGCVGFNYVQTSNTCDIYNQCPTNFTTDTVACQYWQKETAPGRSVCTVSIESSVSAYPYVASSDCSYPFTYNGTVYYNCMPSSSKCGSKACLTSNGQYAYCSLPADYQAQTESVTLMVSIQAPVTVQSVFGWIVIHQRVATNGTAYNWNRNWFDYKNGFGDSSSNFWLGLERMHLLTNSASYKLRIEVQQRSTELWFSAEYSSFKIADEYGSQYELGVMGYSGDAGDALQYTGDWCGDHYNGFNLHNGMKFTTYDSDNDFYDGNCAIAKGGGWWFNRCFYACLTCTDGDTKWLPFDACSEAASSLKAARMMIKVSN